MTIRLRLALLFTVATLVLSGGGGLLFVNRLQAGLENSLDVTLSARADGIISSLRPGASSDAGTRLSNANGIYAQLLSPDGTLLDSSRGVNDRPLITPHQAATAARTPLVANTTVRISAPGDSGPEPMRLLATPTRSRGVILAVVISRDVVDKAVRRAIHQLVVLGLIVVLLASSGSWFLTRAALRPVERMRRQAADLHARDAGAGLAIPRTRDEIARLAETLNGLLDRLHSALARERAFVADAGHELRTPLTVLMGELELARRPGRTAAELADTVQIASEETERLVRVTDDLLLLATAADSPQARFERFDLAALAQAAIQSATPRALARGATIVRRAAGPVEVLGDPDRIRRAIDNLLANALRYSPAGSTVTVGIDTDVHGGVQLTVADQGPGFPAEFLSIAFERFTRADGARARPAQAAADLGGTGLGLAIVRSVMSAHQGTATAANRTEGGAVVTLRWPHPTSEARNAD